jgi:aminomethyltransferase
MVDFAGWEMPVQYHSILEEHRATRSAVALTDISHMGRLRFEGPGAADFLARLLSRRVHGLSLNQVRYSLVTNEQGGILDDVLVGYYHNAHGQPYYVVVVNASNREKIVRWIDKHLSDEKANESGKEILWTDVTRLWAMFAIQGPKSVDLLQPLVDADLSSMRYYNGEQVRILHPSAKRQGGILSRTGYTGEDGFELSVGAEIAFGVWETLMELGKPLGLIPTGLGARDTLRLEAGMPLYGHELTESIHPFEAGLGYACYLTGYDFPGRDALLALKEAPAKRVRIGLEMEGRRPARQGCRVFSPTDGRPIGEVTSGSFSPTLEKPIAMAMVPPEFSEPGTPLSIDIRGKPSSGRVVPLPFYQRPRKKKTS